jgi:hypothetical protein
LASKICTTAVGRPSDSETNNCDGACCLAGYLAGNCGGDHSVKLGDVVKLVSCAGGVAGGGLVGSVPALAACAGLITPSNLSNCRCSNDRIDVKCGRDGSFAGIRCPFDRSACQRKCCRQGRSGGRCTGPFKTKCRCD